MRTEEQHFHMISVSLGDNQILRICFLRFFFGK
jgi:hypothetical protein